MRDNSVNTRSSNPWRKSVHIPASADKPRGSVAVVHNPATAEAMGQIADGLAAQFQLLVHRYVVNPLIDPVPGEAEALHNELAQTINTSKPLETVIVGNQLGGVQIILATQYGLSSMYAPERQYRPDQEDSGMIPERVALFIEHAGRMALHNLEKR